MNTETDVILFWKRYDHNDDVNWTAWTTSQGSDLRWSHVRGQELTWRPRDCTSRCAAVVGTERGWARCSHKEDPMTLCFYVMFKNHYFLVVYFVKSFNFFVFAEGNSHISQNYCM